MAWASDQCGGYTTKSGYKALPVYFEEDNHVDGLFMTCNILWSLKFLYRIKAFGWRSFLNRLTTKDQLNKRGIIT